MIKKVLLWGVLVALVAFVAIQFVPYGHDRTNPPVVNEPQWDSPATRELAVAACYDCHSYETKWPWYARLAPASWLLQNDVDGGREHLNFSDWQGANAGEDGEGGLAETVRSGEMPPWQYKLMHSGARLSDEEREALAQGLEKLAAQ